MKELKAKDILDLIRACKDSGVVKLQMHELILEFKAHDGVTELVNAFSSPSREQPQDESKKELEIKTREQVLEDLLHNDPEAYERELFV